MPCPIWPQDPTHSAGQQGARSDTGTPRLATIVTCPVCGEYEVSDLARIGLETISDGLRIRLTWATRQASDAGAPLVLHSGDVERTTESVAEPTPFEKANLLLLLVASRSQSLAERVSLDPATDWPLVCARGPQELVRLLGVLAKRGFIARTQNLAEGVELTFEGWEQAAVLRSVEAPPTSCAFVAMWFDSSMNPAYDEGFYPVLYGLGYDPIRVDREHYLGKIDDFIIASIRKSALLVADFTGMRSGVFFEAGFGLAREIPVVWTCREDWLEKLREHFDTRQYNHLPWKEPSDLAKRLRERIEATITSRPKPRS